MVQVCYVACSLRWSRFSGDTWLAAACELGGLGSVVWLSLVSLGAVCSEGVGNHAAVPGKLRRMECR